MSDLRRESSSGGEPPVALRKSPLPLSGDQRFATRLAALVVALDLCRARSATVEQLHILVWALVEPDRAKILSDAWVHASLSPMGFRTYTPGLLEIVRVAQAGGLVEQGNNGRQKLTESGTKLARAIAESPTGLAGSRQALSFMAPISTADMWRRLGEA